MADPAEIIDEIEALTVHCRPPIMSVEQRSRWQRDWAQDLAKYPIDVIQSAFRQWRQGESGKFPTPGQILPMLDRMSRPSSSVPTAEQQVWRYDITDDEYRGMTLQEKIRHHRCAASYCRTKAGPMPIHPPPEFRGKEDMPAKWHEWRDRAAKHDAEAQRMQQSIGRWDQRA